MTTTEAEILASPFPTFVTKRAFVVAYYVTRAGAVYIDETHWTYVNADRWLVLHGDRSEILTPEEFDERYEVFNPASQDSDKVSREGQPIAAKKKPFPSNFPI